jgi:HD superfamily phosphodiesterase
MKNWEELFRQKVVSLGGDAGHDLGHILRVVKMAKNWLMRKRRI